MRMSGGQKALTGLFIGLLCAQTTMAWSDDRVVAVVNDAVITASDVDEQCQLNKLDASPELSEQQANALCKRTLQRMIDATLEQQFAVSKKLEPTDDMVEKAWQDNSHKTADIPPELTNAAKEALRNELRHRIILEKVVTPKINVNPAEIDLTIQEMAKSVTTKERKIAQILLTIPEDSNEEQVRLDMEEILKRLKAGEDFASIAKQQSEGSEAADGGVMGWFANGELNPDLEKKLDGLKPGEFSGLIRTPLGWHIVKLLETKQTASISLTPEMHAELVVIGPAPTDNAEKVAALQALRESLKTEADVRGFLTSEERQNWPSSRNLGWVRPREMPDDVQKEIEATSVGAFTPVMNRNNESFMMFKLNEKKMMPPELEGLRERVRKHVYMQRQEQEERRFLRELEQRAFVDIRL